MYLLFNYFAKLVNLAIKIFNSGSGYTMPGHLVLKFYPGIYREVKKRLPEEMIVVTGTNGKTTTSKLIAHLLSHQGFRVLHNSSGANLLNGILSSILLNTDYLGNLPYDVAVFEVDEFTLPGLLKELDPTVVTLLNLSRDQLDRHWEIDLVYEKWLKAIYSLKKDTVLVLDEEQERFNELKEKYQGKVITFGSNPQFLPYTKLLGDFNAKNINCAISIAELFSVSGDKAKEFLEDFEYAYGRGESTTYRGKMVSIFLAKNPESMNQNLKLLLAGDLKYDSLLYILNDNIPDGLDVSWIYDVDPVFLSQVSAKKTVYVSGIRALDMAVRLQYAGVAVDRAKVAPNLAEINDLIANNTDTENLVVLPNYSAMLTYRKLILGRKIL